MRFSPRDWLRLTAAAGLIVLGTWIAHVPGGNPFPYSDLVEAGQHDLPPGSPTVRGDRADWLLARGLGLRDEGRIPEALGHFRLALALQPAFTAAQTFLAETLLDEGQANEAAALLLQATDDRHDPLYLPALQLLAIAALDQREVLIARDVLERILALNPGDEQARQLLDRLPSAAEPKP